MLFPYLTVKNIESGLKEKEFTDLDEMAKFLDVQRILHRKPDTLSGGKSQRATGWR
jgi:ABC-type molybdate transport system ATPase subunit